MNLCTLLLACLACAHPKGGEVTGGQFVKIPAGTYAVGERENVVNPPHKVTLAAYEIGATEVTNAEWARFVKATGYVTEAERLHNALVFRPPLAEFRWLEDSTANWRFPNGVSMGGIADKMDHPVTTISYTDALAYCKWAGVRLPTLDEWEVASRAGSSTHYWWGNDHGKLHEYANIWKGVNHTAFPANDVHLYTAPVGSYKPNPWGLYDMYGNVFEFCAGLPPAFSQLKGVGCARGGSWWCSRNSCNYFNSADIGKANVHASFSNQGFRVVREVR